MRKRYENIRESTESTSASSSTSSSFARSPIHVLFYRLLPDESPYHLKSTRSSFADFHEKPQADMRESTESLSAFRRLLLLLLLQLSLLGSWVSVASASGRAVDWMSQEQCLICACLHSSCDMVRAPEHWLRSELIGSSQLGFRWRNIRPFLGQLRSVILMSVQECRTQFLIPNLTWPVQIRCDSPVLVWPISIPDRGTIWQNKMWIGGETKGKRSRSRWRSS